MIHKSSCKVVTSDKSLHHDVKIINLKVVGSDKNLCHDVRINNLKVVN